MSKLFQGPGKSVAIDGQTADVTAGNIFRRSDTVTRSWIGVVTDDITGTSSDLTTIDGRPIDIGDGVAAEAQTGDGKGDMMVEGVFMLRLPTSGMIVDDGAPVYMDVASAADPTGTTIASGVTTNGPNSANGLNGVPLSGVLVGFAEGAAYTATAAPFNGLRVVDVKLLGLPLHGLAEAGPLDV